MDDQPLVSVVIPAYNAEAFIDEALQSILSQDYPLIEILVVNDGSTDSTAQRVAAYNDKVRYFEQPNSGGFPGSPRNAGIQNAGGEFICFLDADDRMLPGRLQLQVDFLRDQPEVGVVFGNYQNFSTDGPIGDPHFRTCSRLKAKLGSQSSLVLRPAVATALLLRENVGIPSSMMMRRAALDAAPAFSTEFRVGEDFHFYYRILQRFSLGIIDQVVSWRRIHGNNITRDSIRMLHSMMASRSALFEAEQSEENRALLEEVIHQYEVSLARAYANQKQFGRSVAHDLHALRGAFPRRLGWVAGGLCGLARTAAIAMHLKRPSS